ncbi:MAG TPA: hypothetical protein VIF60_03155, partial [Burkholderiaceae bacterium]
FHFPLAYIDYLICSAARLCDLVLFGKLFECFPEVFGSSLLGCWEIIDFPHAAKYYLQPKLSLTGRFRRVKYNNYSLARTHSPCLLFDQASSDAKRFVLLPGRFALRNIGNPVR